MNAVALLALLAKQGPNASYTLRVNVAARQEFDYDLILPGSPRPMRLLYVVQGVSSRGLYATIDWRVQQYGRNPDGSLSDRPSYVGIVQRDERNNPLPGKPRVALDDSSFGTSDEARRVGRLALGALSFEYPKLPVYVGRTWGARPPNPFVKGASYQVDYKLTEERTVHSWDCYRIEMAASLAVGSGGREIGLEGEALVERSTGVPVTVDLRVTGANAVSESLNRAFRLHLTRDRDER